MRNELFIKACYAGAAILPFFRTADLASENKLAGGYDPVTSADRASETAMREILGRDRPDDGILGEEYGATPGTSGLTWVLDPIDGTRAFIAGQAGFAHSLAVAEGHRIIAAVVHLPAMDLTFTAHADGPALLNGQPIRPSGAGIGGARVLTYKSATDPEHWKGGRVPPFRREFRPSLAWRLCLVAEGRFDAALSVRHVWEWDIAAGSLIAERAGAIATDRHGQPMRFNSPRAMIDGMVVAGPRLHRDMRVAMT